MSKTSFNIRPFVPADLQAVHEVREAAFKPVFSSFTTIVGKDIAAIAYANAEADQGAHLDDVCQPDSDYHICVAIVENRVVGFCSYSMDGKHPVGRLGLNAVHPDYDGVGIGTSLYEHALAEMKEVGMLAATVGTGGDESHASARRAYEKAGFDKVIPSLLYYRKL